MKRIRNASPILIAMATAGVVVASPAVAEEEFDESIVLVEINATDGDVGFHAKFDAGAWRQVKMYSPDGLKIFQEQSTNALTEQGLTENFFESAEPLCEPDPEEPDDEVVTLAEFLDRFPAGDYILVGKTNENEELIGDAELTYDLPAAPDISATDESEQPLDNVVVAWGPGTDLGESCHDQALVDLGIIADPALVPVVAWEVAIEPDTDEPPVPERTLSMLLPPGQTSVSIPQEFLQQYFDDGQTEIKFEVGAIEASGNRTFSEGGFELTDD